MPGRLLVLILFLFLPFITQGAFLDIVINEIAWMGTENSANDEWIVSTKQPKTLTSLSQLMSYL